VALNGLSGLQKLFIDLPERVRVMEINPNRNVDPVTPAASLAKAKAAGASAPSDVSFEQSDWLSSALAAAPDAREEVVIRAENLVASSSYPPTELIKSIANLLAANLLTQEN
jgi:hypothetical protein